MLVSMLSVLVPKSAYLILFGHNDALDSALGTLAGSVSVGNPLVSYVLGGELLGQGIGMVSVTAFIVSWTTVGVAQFPAESAILGRRFSFLRNVSAFFLALAIAVIVTAIMSLLR